MKGNLPKSWEVTSISEVFSINPGHSGIDISDDTEVSFVPMPEIEEGTGRLNPGVSRLYKDVKKGYTKFAEGDVLFAKITPCMENGKIAIAEGLINGVGCGTTEVFVFRQQGSVLAKYLFYYLVQKNFRQYAKSKFNGAVGHLRVPASIFEEDTFPLPPLAEQSRIVAQLDAVMQKLEASQERLDKMPDLLKKFRQAVLGAAVSGKLTEAWRAEQQEVELAVDVLERVQHDRLSQVRTARAKSALEEIFDIVEEGQHFELPDTWQFVALDKLAASFNYGTSAKSENTGAVPVLRMGNLQGGKIDWSDLKYTSSPEEIEQYSLNTGDVLFNRTNSPELVGKTAIYRGEQPAIFAGYLIRIKATPALNPEYLNYCLNSSYARQYCWNVKTDGVSQSNINAQKLSRFEVPFCSLSEQEEIVRQVKHYFGLADQLEARFEQAAELVEQLPQALLAKAFSGQLVPQDPDDEPASTLLKRLHAELAAPVKGKRGRKAKVAADAPLFE
jgi:type I restriction enzyme S subunit